MADITVTRQAIRRAICAELQMPFFRRFASGYSEIDTSSTTTKIIDASLTQKDNFWNGSWLFHVADGDVSLIRFFEAAGNSLQLETPLAATPDNGDDYEIHTLWNAIEIHRAINRAITMAGRTFAETITDETLIIKENVLAYLLTGLTKRPYVLNKVGIENPPSVVRGTASAGGATSITVASDVNTSDIDTNWRISIYAGTGAGQLKSVASVAGQVITVTAWTTAPDNTSKYALWDVSDERYDWIPFDLFYTDAKEFPDYLRLRGTLATYYGLRMRLEYLAVPSELSTDADTTVVPSEYILAKVCSLLHGQKLNDTRADHQMHYAEMERYRQMADEYMANNLPHMPDASLRAPYTTVRGNIDDPLNWYG